MKKRKSMNQKGFTLIELLGVIVIIGVLLGTAVYVGSVLLLNARKSIYVTNAREFLKSARYEMSKNTKRFYPVINDPNTTYYIPLEYFEMDRNTGSPWGPWKHAYVVMALDEDNNYEYAWASKDVANYTVKTVKEEELDVDDVIYDDTDLNYAAPLGTRDHIVVLDKDLNVKIETTQSLELTKLEADECFSYELIDDGKSAKITYYDSSKPECGPDVIIPGRIGGYAVKEIYYYSFYKKGLNSVVIPEGVTTIGQCAFQGNNLTKVVLPSSLVSIGTEAFDANKIPEINFPTTGNLQTIGARAFRTNQLKTYTIPESVTSVGACAFCKNPLINQGFIYAKGDYSTITGFAGDISDYFDDAVFEIPEEHPDHPGVKLKKIKAAAFRNLTMTGWTVIIPNTVEVIETEAFYGTNASEFSIFTDPTRTQSHLKTIGTYAFYTNKMTTLYIPNSVTSIGALAFTRNAVTTGDKFIYKRVSSGNHIDYSTIIGYSVKDAKNVVIPETANGVALKKIDTNAFRYANLKGTITISQSVTSIGQLAFALNYLTDVNNGPGDTENAPFVYARDSSKTGGFDKTRILSYANYNVNTVTIPEGVTKLEPYSFYYSNIYHVNLPNSLTTISAHAFEICHLTGKVTIPPNVTTIGTNAFRKRNVWTKENADMTEIVNQTNREFDWQAITAGSEPAKFKTGTAKNWYGDIKISKGW